MSPSPPLTADTLAPLSLHTPSSLNIQHAQTSHRLSILSHFPPIAEGSSVLELGCGQGDMTAVLAAAVGAGGRVVAVDPAPLEYGSPFTLGEAQAHLSASPLGPRIHWVQSTPLEHLASLPFPNPSSSTTTTTSSNPSPNSNPSPDPATQEPKAYTYSHAFLAHSIFYFPSPSHILTTLQALRPHCQTLCLAEWSLRTSLPEQHAHVLAVLAQASLECRKGETASNVRTVLAPSRLRALAVQAGWKEESSTTITPEQGILDGQWEVSAVLSPSFQKQVEEYVEDERERSVVLALRDAVEAEVGGLDGGVRGVRAMDVWVGVFV